LSAQTKRSRTARGKGARLKKMEDANKTKRSPKTFLPDEKARENQRSR